MTILPKKMRKTSICINNLDFSKFLLKIEVQSGISRATGTKHWIRETWSFRGRAGRDFATTRRNYQHHSQESEYENTADAFDEVELLPSFVSSRGRVVRKKICRLFGMNWNFSVGLYGVGCFGLDICLINSSKISALLKIFFPAGPICFAPIVALSDGACLGEFSLFWEYQYFQKIENKNNIFHNTGCIVLEFINTPQQ